MIRLSKELLTRDQLAKVFDECVECLGKRTAERLLTLSSALHSIAEVTENTLYYVARRPIGSYGNEVMRFYPFVAVPILSKDIRPVYTGLFDKAVAEGIKSLKILKEEFCEKENMDITRVLDALGELEKYGYRLYEAIANIKRLRLPIPVPTSEEEE